GAAFATDALAGAAFAAVAFDAVVPRVLRAVSEGAGRADPAEVFPVDREAARLAVDLFAAARDAPDSFREVVPPVDFARAVARRWLLPDSVELRAGILAVVDRRELEAAAATLGTGSLLPSGSSGSSTRAVTASGLPPGMATSPSPTPRAASSPDAVSA
ncbi:hypothetical protein AB0M54_25440, partial [Actinoplanes sp. NPDC051470]|uniref:hypothetical protein n=1 Tax=Actinoplanes sp. NPDC051470 TaxID=3157224 RepID=UPI00343932B2